MGQVDADAHGGWIPLNQGRRSLRAADHSPAAKGYLWQLDPDILCLQEVRDWKVVQEAVSGLPGCHVAIVSQFEGQQQQAIVSSLPVDSAWYEEWRPGRQPIRPAGKADIYYAVDDSLMLIFDVLGKTCALWRIRDMAAKPVPFDIIEDA